MEEKIKNNEIKEDYNLIGLINTIKIKNSKRELFPIIHKLSSPEKIKNKLGILSITLILTIIVFSISTHMQKQLISKHLP